MKLGPPRRKVGKELMKKKSIKIPIKDRDLPVTKRLLDLTRQELQGEISSLRLEMRSGFASIDARFQKQDSKFEAIQTQITKIMIILEDQNDRNRAALDGYAAVYERFIDTEKRIRKKEKSVFGTKQR